MASHLVVRGVVWEPWYPYPPSAVDCEGHTLGDKVICSWSETWGEEVICSRSNDVSEAVRELSVLCLLDACNSDAILLLNIASKEMCLALSIILVCYTSIILLLYMACWEINSFNAIVNNEKRKVELCCFIYFWTGYAVHLANCI